MSIGKNRFWSDNVMNLMMHRGSTDHGSTLSFSRSHIINWTAITTPKSMKSSAETHDTFDYRRKFFSVNDARMCSFHMQNGGLIRLRCLRTVQRIWPQLKWQTNERQQSEHMAQLVARVGERRSWPYFVQLSATHRICSADWKTLCNMETKWVMCSCALWLYRLCCSATVQWEPLSTAWNQLLLIKCCMHACSSERVM